MGPTAVKSKLGYLLSGPMPTMKDSTVPDDTLNVLVQNKKEETDLELFWKLKSTGVTRDEFTKKGQVLLRDIYESTISHRDNHCNTITKLSCKDNLTELPRTIRRLNREPEIQKIYSSRARKNGFTKFPIDQIYSLTSDEHFQFVNATKFRHSHSCDSHRDCSVLIHCECIKFSLVFLQLFPFTLLWVL